MRNSERLLNAIGEIGEEKIEKAGRLLDYGGRRRRDRRVSASVRRGLVLAAAAALLLALGATAWALGHGGIRELWPQLTANRTAFPGTAEEWIEPREEAAQTEDWRCRILETYCDDTQIVITASITCSDRFLPVPTDADESYPAAALGFDGDGTLGEYAAGKGKELLYLNLGVNDDRIGEIGASIHFENVSDSELLILHDGRKVRSFDTLDTWCTVVAQRGGAEDIERVKIPLTLRAGTSKVLAVYRPVDPAAVPGVTDVGEATLSETPLGLVLQYPAAGEDSEAGRAILYFACEEIDFRGRALGFTAEDGTEYARLTMGEGETPDTLTIHYYDWDKQLIGDLVFRRTD